MAGRGAESDSCATYSIGSLIGVVSTLAAVADAFYLWADADSPAAKQLGPEASVILAFLCRCADSH